MEDGRDEDVIHKRELLSNGGEDINAIGNDERGTLLHIAAENSVSDIVKKLLPTLRDDPSIATEMIKAQVRRGADTVDRLLRHGARANARNQKHCTPLHLAATNGDLFDIIKVFREVGLDKGERAGECFEESVLNTAIDTTRRIIKLLVARGAEINAKDERSQTPLHVASEVGGPWDITKELLSHGANVHAQDCDGRTPLHLATLSGSIDVIRALIQSGADVNAADHRRRTPLHLKSAVSGPMNSGTLSLERAYNINPENYHGQLHLVLRSDPSSIINELVSHGADLNAVDELGQTPLHVAVVGGSIRIIETLLKNGANVNAERRFVPTPIQTVVLYEKRNIGPIEDVFKVLLEYGADLETRDEKGQTMAHLLCLDLVDTFTQTDVGPQLDMMTQLFSYGADVNAKDQKGYTPHTIMMRLRFTSVSKKWTPIKAAVDSHVSKLIALGAARVAEKNRSLYFDVLPSWGRAKPRVQTQSIEREKYGNDYYAKCVAEVERLKATKIVGDISLADVLTLGNPATLAKFSDNVDFREHASENSKFPIYLFLIKNRYEKSLKMKSLCDNCEIALGVISLSKMSTDCAYRILSYLSEVELKNLCEAARKKKPMTEKNATIM